MTLDLKKLTTDLAAFNDPPTPPAAELPVEDENPFYRDDTTDLSAPTTTPLPPILDAAEFVAHDLVAPHELIAGLLNQGTKMVIGGGSKSFKTWVQLDIALAVASGQTWMERPCLKSKVLFVNFEIQPSFFQARVRAVAKARGITVTPGMLSLWNLRGHAASHETIVPTIRDTIRELGYALVVIDPIYKLYGKTDENSAGEVALLMNALETICVESGAAVLFGAHYSKGNQAAKESIDRISGSGVFARDPDSIMSFTKHEEEGAFVIEPTLRNLPPVDPWVVRWQFPLMQIDESLDPAELKQPKTGRPNTTDPQDLWNLLPDEGLLLNDWFNLATQKLSLSRSTFYRQKNQLVSDDLILHSKINNHWKPVKSQPNQNQ